MDLPYMIEIGVLGFGTESAKNHVLFHLFVQVGQKNHSPLN